LQIYSDGTTGQITGDLNITGTLTSDGLTVDGTVDFSTGTGSNVVLGNTGSFTGSETAQLVFEEGSTELAQVQWNPSGNTFVLENKIYNAPISFRTFGATERLKIDGATGDISFYEDTGTTAKFFWDASAESLGIGTTTISRKLNIQGDQGIRLFNNAANSYLDIDHGTDGALIKQSVTSKDILLQAGTASGQLVFQTGGSEAMRIDSSGRVGIGTTSPLYTLHVNSGAAQSTMRLEADAGVNPLVSFLRGTTDVAQINGAFYGLRMNGFQVITFDTGNSEAMRIDSSGNLLVGKTVATFGTDGHVLWEDGLVDFSRTAISTTMRVNKNTHDGDLISFSKDGTTVGSIGVAASNLTLTGFGSTIRVGGTTAGVWPETDNTLNIGTSATRFKDLYLSGGVYLGGTGSANKLDDYEEGTWTPVYYGNTTQPTITYDAVTTGEYVKIGRLVHCQGRIRTDAVSGGSGALNISGLPFTADGTSNNFSTLCIGYVHNWDSAHGPAAGYINPISSRINLVTYNGSDPRVGSSTSIDVTDLLNGANSNDLIFSFTYKAAN
jgi:hypothetical protein